MHGLERLEYRGYDSAGLSLLGDGADRVGARGRQPQPPARGRRRERVERRRHRGRDQDRRGDDRASATRAGPRTASRPSATRTRTPTARGRVHIVLNGIIENYVELRDALEAEGHDFASETDAEAVAHLIEKHLDALGPGNLTEATRLAYLELRGHYAFVAVSADEPDTIVGARKDCPLVVGVGESEHFIASAIPAFLRETRQVQLVNDDEIVTVRRGRREFRSAAGVPVEREVEEITWDEDAAEKAGYPTFMLKEIHEQSDAVAETIADRLAHARPRRPGRHRHRRRRAREGAPHRDRRVRDLLPRRRSSAATRSSSGRACPVEMDIASEYRYRNPVVGPDDLVIGISQSGETADTLAAMRLARSRGAHVLAITNILGSQATRDADGVLYTRAGLEIGVAATKTFVAQVAAMYLLGLKLAELRHTMEPGRARGPDRRAEGDPAPHRQAARRRATSRCARSRAATSSATSSSTWAATSGCPSASRAR